MKVLPHVLTTTCLLVFFSSPSFANQNHQLNSSPNTSIRKEEIKEVVDVLSMVMWYLNIMKPHKLFGIPKEKDVEIVRITLEKWKKKLKEQ